MKILGLTGTIASGKSTVAALLAQHGAEVIDCDRLAHAATAPGEPTLAAIATRFGPSVVTPGGALDRARLAAIVFADPAALADLEAIVHPAVRARRDALLAASTRAVAVIEAIKLVEAGYHRQCDALWVVTAPEAVRLDRLVRLRGLDPAAARQRLVAQGDFAHQLSLADEVLVNDGDEAQLAARVATAWAAFRQRCGLA